MEIGQTPANSNLAGTIGAQTVPEAQSDISADFDTFLTLLTAQLRNQDPLNPLDSTDFIAQLASFSAVEQQTRTNELLQDFLANVSEADLTSLVDWVGREIAVTGPARFDGDTPLDLEVEPALGATSAELWVQNEAGVDVARIVADPAATELRWDGRLSAGGTAPAGTYNLRVEYRTPGGTETVTPAAFQPVTEVRLDPTGPQLVSAGGSAVPVEQVIAVRDPA